MANYINLTHKPDTYVLDSFPSGYWLLYSLEIVISDGVDTSILLTYPSYSLSLQDRREIILAPPFVAFPVLPGTEYLNSLGRIRQMFWEAEQNIDAASELKRRLYLMGVPSAEIRKTGEIVEYKQSPREPAKMKCYKVHRYSVTLYTDAGMLNLADPEGLKECIFLPLNRIPGLLVQDGQLTPEVPRYTYLGKPLAPYLNMVLHDQNDLARLLSSSILTISPGNLIYGETGILIKLKIEGYWAAREMARIQHYDFLMTEYGVNFMSDYGFAKLLTFELARLGLTEVRVTNNGFTAAVPSHRYVNSSTEDTVKMLLSLVSDIDGLVSECNSKLSQLSQFKPMNTLAIILEGSYRYGKIAGLIGADSELDSPLLDAIDNLMGQIRVSQTDFFQNALAAVSSYADPASNSPDLARMARYKRLYDVDPPGLLLPEKLYNTCESAQQRYEVLDTVSLSLITGSTRMIVARTRS